MCKKITKRYLSVLCAVAMLVSMMVVQVQAAEDDLLKENNEDNVIERGSIPWQLSSVGFAIAKRDIPVYENKECTEYKNKKIFANEGFTIIDDRDRRLQDDYVYVDYSTPNGYRQGWIQVKGSQGSWAFTPYWETVAATVTTTTSVWYGENADIYQTCGTVYKNESVALLEKGDYWAFIEYNTNAGRKRGFVPYSYLRTCTSDQYVKQLHPGWVNYKPDYPAKTYVVYSGPTRQYVQIDQVFASDAIRVIYDKNIVVSGQERVRFIAYHDHQSGKLDRTGYIIGE